MSPAQARIRRLLSGLVVFLTLFLATPCLSTASSGDVDGNGHIGLEDAILCLQVVSSLLSDRPIFYDINHDGKTGLAEAIYLLQVAARLRTDEGAEIALIVNRLLNEIQAGLSEDDRAQLADIAAYVADYAYASRMPLEIPEEDEAFTIEPIGSFDLYRMFGISAFLQGSMKGALWTSLKAVEANLADPQSLSQTGLVLSALGRYEEALLFLKRAGGLDSENDTTRINMAVSYLGLGQKSEAFEEAAAAVAINPKGTVVREVMANLFLDDISRDLRNQACQHCAQWIREALLLGTQEEATAFVASQQTALNSLTLELVGLISQMPYTDEVMSYVLNPLHGQFDDADAAADNDYQTTLEAIVADLQGRIDPLVIQAADCVQANPDNGCFCLKNFATGVSIEVDISVPLADEATRDYLLGKLNSYIQREIQLQEVIVGTMNQGDESQWAYAHLYKNLQMKCLETVLGTALGMEHRLSFKNAADHTIELADWTCESIQAALEEYRRWQAEKEEERLEQQRLLEELRREYQESKNLNLKGEVCLGPIICLGVDGTAVSLKVGSGAFAKFTADVEKFDVSVRVGVELGVGPLVGGDLSVGCRVTGTGTAVNVEASESRFFGTKGQTVEIWGAKRSF